MKNKKNFEELINPKFSKGELLSIWWIFVIAVIAGGIVIAVSIYYSAEININGYHAGILGERINNCIIKNGNFLYDLDKFQFFEECKINKKIFDKGNFFVKILVYDKEVIYNKKYGNLAYEKDCEIVGKISSKSSLKCVNKKEIANYQGKEIIVEITSGINQEGEKISITNE